jgi:hypothetical protein
MSNVAEFTSPTLDGLMQALGRPDEGLVLGSGRPLADGAQWPRSDSSTA